MQREFKKIKDELVGWSRTWLLNFNAGKYKVMHAGARNGRANYFMEGTEIQAVSEEKYLGIVVDDKLRFSRHIAAAACADRKLGLLKHIQILDRGELSYTIRNVCSPTPRVLHPGLYPDT